MKSSGLSSKTRKVFKQTTKVTAFAALQESHLAAKEKQRFLRMQAAKAQFERAKKQNELQPQTEVPETGMSSSVVKNFVK